MIRRFGRVQQRKCLNPYCNGIYLMIADEKASFESLVS